jgi:hypothetical protein
MIAPIHKERSTPIQMLTFNSYLVPRRILPHVAAVPVFEYPEYPAALYPRRR